MLNHDAYVGYWQASEILSAAVPESESDDLIQLQAMTFIERMGKAGRCEVAGIRANETTPSVIPLLDLQGLLIDPCGEQAADANIEYGEATAHPAIIGSNYQEKTWRRLRYRRSDIEALRSSFATWRRTGGRSIAGSGDTLGDTALVVQRDPRPVEATTSLEDSASLEEFVKAYVSRCRAEGIPATQIGLVERAGGKFKRDALRDCLSEHADRIVGRPRKWR
jgi:hypothetical protein